MNDTVARYESPIEEALGERLRGLLADGVVLRSQAWIETTAGRFRLDLMVTAPGMRLAIECDGRDFHDGRRDEWRDAMALGDDQADAVVRFRGCDIHYSVDDCVAVLHHWYPGVLSVRGAALAEGRASAALRDWKRDVAGGRRNVAQFHYGTPERSRFRAERQGFGLARRAFWVTAFGHALKHPGSRLDDLMASYLAGSPWESRP